MADRPIVDADDGSKDGLRSVFDLRHCGQAL